MANATRQRNLLSYMLAVVLVLVAAKYVSAHGEHFREVAWKTPSWLPALGLAVIINLAIHAWFLKQLAGELNATISARECFCLVGASSMFEALTLPAAGAAYRGFYLHKFWGVPIMSYWAGLAVFSFARLFVWGLAAGGSVLCIAAEGGDVWRIVIPLLFVGIVVLFAALIVERMITQLVHDQVSEIGTLAAAGLQIVYSTRIRASAIVSMLMYALVQVLIFYLIFRSSGLPIDIINSTTITAFHQLSGILALTPGGLGIQEAASVIPSRAIGVRVADILIALGLMRAARFLLAIAIGGPCWWLLSALNNGHRKIRPAQK